MPVGRKKGKDKRMREILFRAKLKSDNGIHKKGEWVYGHYCELIDGKKAIPYIYGNGEVNKNTIGQYTGLTDKNGKKVFEGDIVKNDWCFLRGYSVIKFGQYKPLDMSNDYQQGHLGFYLEHIHKVDKNTARKDIMYFANKCEVIGNIHDNPELLESEVDTE